MNIAIILAGGKGTRLNSSIPKQYIEINDKPIIVYTIEKFEKNDYIDRIIVVAEPQYHIQIANWKEKYNLSKLDTIIEGGKTRQESSFLALLKLEKENIDKDSIVLIHDAARPLVSQRIIDENVDRCKNSGLVNTCIDVTDTILYTEDKKSITKTLNRNTLVASQTPQTFKFSLILEAHKKFANQEVTDDCQLGLLMSYPVSIVNGDIENIKITTSRDLELFKLLSKENEEN